MTSASQDGFVQRSEVRRLTPELAEMYAAKKDKTLTRDLNAIVSTGLVERKGHKYRARREMILAFLPLVRREQFVEALREAKPIETAATAERPGRPPKRRRARQLELAVG
jgi:hypothetical protein